MGSPSSHPMWSPQRQAPIAGPSMASSRQGQPRGVAPTVHIHARPFPISLPFAPIPGRGNPTWLPVPRDCPVRRSPDRRDRFPASDTAGVPPGCALVAPSRSRHDPARTTPLRGGRRRSSAGLSLQVRPCLPKATAFASRLHVNMHDIQSECTISGFRAGFILSRCARCRPAGAPCAPPNRSQPRRGFVG